MNDSSLPAKLYFRIGEVASIVGVEPHVLRYWEREFRSIRPTKSAKGQRVYSRRDVENLMRVRQLLYGEGFTIAGARKKLLRTNGHEPSAGAVPSPPVMGDALVLPSIDAPVDAVEVLVETRARFSEPTIDDGREPIFAGERRSPPPDRDGALRATLTALRGEIQGLLAELDG